MPNPAPAPAGLPAWIPESTRRAVKRLFYRRFKRRIGWEYLPQGWEAPKADPDIKGWNVEAILETYREKWPVFLEHIQGPGPLGIGHEFSTPSRTDLTFHNMNLSYGYVLALAARGRPSLSLLDWGGGIGHYLALSRALLPGVTIDYHCKDVPVLAAYGRTLFPEAHFYDDESCLARRYDLVMASGSMHYSQDWAATLTGLARATAPEGYLYIARLPVVQEAPSYVFVQRPYNMGYDTEYLGWCLNQKELIKAAGAAGMTLVREFVSGERPYIDQAPEQCEYKGFLFRPTAAADK